MTIKEIASEFQQTTTQIEADMIELITQGKLPYKIDDKTQTVIKKQANQKLQTLQNTLYAGEHYINDTQNFLLRAQVMNDYNGKQ